MSKYCENCGAMVMDDGKFCENCGARLPEDVVVEAVDVVIERPKNYGSPAADAREVRERLVGTKQEYYLPRFEKMETLNSVTGWNWAAFFFSTVWMMYRKMYVFGGAVWLASNLLSAIGLGSLGVVISIAMGVLGNYLYMKDINNRVDKAMDMQPEERELYIQKNSGTGWVGVIVLFALSMVLGTILY